MVKEDNINTTFIKYREQLIRLALKRVNTELGMDAFTLELMVDDLPGLLYKSKKQFIDNNHIKAYLFSALAKNIKVLFKNRCKERDYPELTTQQRLQNFELAKSIIDKARNN